VFIKVFKKHVLCLLFANECFLTSMVLLSSLVELVSLQHFDSVAEWHQIRRRTDRQTNRS